MLQILAETKDNIIATRAAGNLTHYDYGKFLPLLINLLRRYKKVRLFFEMEDVEGRQIKTFWDDVKFDVQHINCYEKIAMVGKTNWQALITDILQPFIKTEIKFFELSERDTALNWIASDY